MREPKFYKKLRIIGFIFLALSAICIATGITLGILVNMGFIALAGVGGILSIFVATVCFVEGYSPKIARAKIEGFDYVQQSSKENLQNISNATGDLISPVVAKTTRAIKQGLKDTKYCKHCGAEIDADSKFCNKCGKEQ